MWKYPGVFVLMIVLEFVWARTVRYVGGEKAVTAATYAAVTVGLGCFNTILYVHDYALIAPAMAGAFVGTWLCMRSAR